MPIKVTCTQCGKTLLAPERTLGKRVKCASCGTVLVVREPEAVSEVGLDAEILEEAALEADSQEGAARTPSPAKPADKGKMKLLVILGIVVALLVLAKIGGFLVPVIMLGVVVAILAGIWRVFSKAGQPGWAAFVPIYNTYIILKIAGKPGWWLLLLFVPLLNLIVWILALRALAARFGKGVGFTLGLLFLPMVFYPILGLGSATYSDA